MDNLEPTFENVEIPVGDGAQPVENGRGGITVALNRTPDASGRLNELEKIIKEGRQTFFDVGNALAQIMEEQLYLVKGFGSFTEYYETVWGFKKSYAYQLVQSAEVMKELPATVSTMVETFNPSQVRELVKIPKEQRELIIKTAVDKSKSAGRKMTAKDISESARPVPATVGPVVGDVKVHYPRRAETQRRLEAWYFKATKQERGQFWNLVFTSQ